MDVRILALLAAFIPSLLWLWFFTSRDRYEREPKSLILKLFLWGLVAGGWAAGWGTFVRGTFEPAANSAGEAGAVQLAVGLLLIGTVLAALNEETMKYLVTSHSARHNPNFNEPVDGMIYMTTAALGLAAGENFLYITRTFIGILKSAAEQGAAAQQAVPGAFLYAFGVVAPMRALLSTIGHVSWSGIVGYFLAQHVLRGKPSWVILGGILFATVLHSAFNFPLDVGPRFGAEGFFTGYFMTTVLVWGVSLLIYIWLLRRSLAASPFRAQQLAAAPTPAAPAKPVS